MDELKKALDAYREAKATADLASGWLAQAERDLLALMQEQQRKTVTYSHLGKKFTATYTQRTVMNINEKGLRKALTAKVYDKFTVRKLDRKALEDAMERGVVDPRTVAQYVEPVPGKTFLTYRVKDDDEATEGS